MMAANSCRYSLVCWFPSAARGTPPPGGHHSDQAPHKPSDVASIGKPCKMWATGSLKAIRYAALSRGGKSLRSATVTDCRLNTALGVDPSNLGGCVTPTQDWKCWPATRRHELSILSALCFELAPCEVKSLDEIVRGFCSLGLESTPCGLYQGLCLVSSRPGS
jgi:hypothetical protein